MTGRVLAAGNEFVAVDTGVKSGRYAVVRRSALLSYPAEGEYIAFTKADVEFRTNSETMPVAAAGFVLKNVVLKNGGQH